MKRMLRLLLLFLAPALSAIAAPFSPVTLKLLAPPSVYYNFQGGNLSIPLTVTGTPANVTFLVFTRGKATAIKNIRNGYLGWHYVNGIDTCIYVSSPYQFDLGKNAIAWNGRTKNGALVSSGDYTYYLWGYDNISRKTIMTRHLSPSPWNFRTILEKDKKGVLLVKPILYMGDGVRTASAGGKDLTVDYVHTNYKWTIGEDPENKQFLETCTTKGMADAGGLAFLPYDQTRFFHDTLKNGQKKVTKKWTWVPNGAAVLNTDWGLNGEYTYSGAWPGGANFGPGVVSDGGDNLLLVNADVSGAGKISQLMWIDASDGSDVRKMDLSAWWVNLAEGDTSVGGQYTGGPTEMSFRNGLIALGSSTSCTNSLIDPAQTTLDAAVLWVNKNGDYFGDLNWEPTSPRPWVCNDYNALPRKYSTSMDKLGFVIFPVYDMGAVSFGLYAPDGTGIGYKAFAGETSGPKYGADIIDYGSPYDGIYTSQTTADSSASEGIWFTAQDSFKGTITVRGMPTGPYLLLTSPNGGDAWGTGTPHKITWDSRDVQTVKIEYSTDGGNLWLNLSDNVDGASGIYSWTPMGIDSASCRIRITDISGRAAQITSSLFIISSPAIKLTSPNGGELWDTGVQQFITWSYIGFDAVNALNLEYSTDKGVTWNLIASSVPAINRRYTWITPGKVSSECLIRISYASNPSLSDTSDTVFSLSDHFIRLISPNSVEEWEGYSSYSITWISSKDVTKIRIELSSDGGTTWNTIASGVDAAKGSPYLWSGKNFSIDSSKCIIRISDEANSAFLDTSDTYFSMFTSIPQWSVYNTSNGMGSSYVSSVAADPRGGVWAGTRDKGVYFFNGTRWFSYTTANSAIVTNDIYAVAVDKNGVVWIGATWQGLMRFDGTTWTTYSTLNSPLPDNSIRDIAVDGNNTLWITTWGGGSASFDGTNWKTYSTGTDAEILAVDLDNSIWLGYKSGMGGVSHYVGGTWIHYSGEGLPGKYVYGIAVDLDGTKWFSTSAGVGSYDGEKWTSFDLLKGQPVRAVAVDKAGVKWFGYPGGVVRFDSSVWKNYSTQNSGLGGNTITRIAVDRDNLKWFGTENGGISSFFFECGPFVTITSPNGGEIWESGSVHEITWMGRDINNLRIEYSADSGKNWNLISDFVDASKRSYTWSAPSMQSFHCRVRLTETGNHQLTDTSNGEYIISPPFVSLTEPNGGEKLIAGSSFEITWIYLGVELLRIEYSTDGGKTWQKAIDIDAPRGSFLWKIPDIESTSCLIRATDMASASRTDTTDSFFTIVHPFITIKAPNGGEIWNVGKNYPITWDSEGVDKVKLEFSTDGGASWIQIISFYEAYYGSFSFSTNMTSSSCLVRVSDQTNVAVSDKSDSLFTVTSTVSSAGDTTPLAFAVFQNTPNPFNPKTTITFTLPREGQVAVNVYNLAGQRVDSILDVRLNAGRHMVAWNAARFSAGVYLCHVHTEKEAKTIKMLLLK
ncbi:MAG: two-component regulator propeller domain-containing protein [Candidatus Latescibacter sp.]|nr:two-component regulator propeller domain-containing protein [Candidatus Latescibacter sp.]